MRNTNIYIVAGGRWIFILVLFWFFIGVFLGYKIGYIFYEPKTITQVKVTTEKCKKEHYRKHFTVIGGIKLKIGESVYIQDGDLRFDGSRIEVKIK